MPDPVRFGESASTQGKEKCCGTLSRAAAAATSRYSDEISFARPWTSSPGSALPGGESGIRVLESFSVIRGGRPTRKQSLGEIHAFMDFLDARIGVDGVLRDLPTQRFDLFAQLSEF